MGNLFCLPTYLKFPRWELKPLDSQQSLKLVQAAAKHFQIKLTHQKARELATQGNGNPQFLIRAVSETNIKLETDPDQQEWLDLTPLVLCGLAALMVLRFIGQGLSDRNLVVMGGIFMVIGRISTIVTMRVSKQRSKIGQ